MQTPRHEHGVHERITNGATALILTLALTLLSFSCAGGSGSSGFDLAENEAINMALDEQRCVESEGLTICPAGTPTHSAPDVTMTPTVTPLPATPTPTPTTDAVDFPTGTPSVPPAQQTATTSPRPTSTPRATHPPIPSPTATVGMTITTSFDGTEGATCIPSDMPGICILPFTFAARGFTIDTHYQVAVRSADDEPWELFDAVQVSFDALTSNFGADIPVETAAAQGPTASVFLQTAVLVFLDEPPLLPASELIESLGESGADSAYVSPLEQLTVVQ